MIFEYQTARPIWDMYLFNVFKALKLYLDTICIYYNYIFRSDWFSKLKNKKLTSVPVSKLPKLPSNNPYNTKPQKIP